MSDCDNCLLKKRKCSRDQPKCQACLSIGLSCTYNKKGSHSKSKTLEDRLKKLESIVNMLSLDETSDDATTFHSSPPMPNGSLTNLNMSNNQFRPSSPAMSTLTNSASMMPDILRPELEDLFFSTGSSYLLINEADGRKAIQESLFLRNIVYCLASSVAPPALVPSQFSSREEMAEFYFKKAESFIKRVFRKPSYHATLGLFGLVLYCTRTNRAPEAFYYYTVGVRIALSLGLNKESTYQAPGMTEQTKDAMRSAWWSIYIWDRMLGALRYEEPLIKDHECQVRLLGNSKVLPHSQDHSQVMEIALMSSAETFIPSPRNLCIDNYLILLTKINTRVLNFAIDDSIKPFSSQYYQKELLITASLNEWYSAIPDKVKYVVRDISGDAPPTDKATWKRAFMMILYYCHKIAVPKVALLANIEENPDLAASSNAAREIFMAARELHDILQGFLKHNPSFLHAPPFIAPCLFAAGVLVLLLGRLNLTPNDATTIDAIYVTIVNCINLHATLFNVGNAQKMLLEHLSLCQDPTLMVMVIKSLRNMRGDTTEALSREILGGDDDQDDPNDSIHPSLHSSPRMVSSVPQSAINSPHSSVGGGNRMQPPYSPHITQGNPIINNNPINTPMMFNDPSILQNVAQMQSPFAEMMMVGLNSSTSIEEAIDFSTIFG